MDETIRTGSSAEGAYLINALKNEDDRRDIVAIKKRL